MQSNTILGVSHSAHVMVGPVGRPPLLRRMPQSGSKPNQIKVHVKRHAVGVALAHIDPLDLHGGHWRTPLSPARPAMGRIMVRLNQFMVRPVLALGEAVMYTMLYRDGFRRSRLRTPVGTMKVLRCHGQGSGPPVVLMTGIGGDATDYIKVLKLLRKDFSSVTSLSLPTRAPKGVHVVTDAQMIAAVTGALDQLIAPGSRPLVVGHSLGSYYAAHYAYRRPNRVGGVALTCPIGAPFSRTQRRGLDAMYSLDTFEKARYIVHNAFFDDNKDNVFIAAFAWARLCMSLPRAMVRGGAMTTPLPAPLLEGIKPPVMLIWGDKDHLLPADHFSYFVRHLPARTQVIRAVGVNHNNTARAPVTVMKPLTRFGQQIRKVALRSVNPGVRRHAAGA